MKSNKVCILGGTGFVGRHLAATLSANEVKCVIPSRHPQRHRNLQVAGQAELIQANPFDQQELEPLLEGCDAAVNLAGILNESGDKRSFKRIHIELTDTLVNACKAAGVRRLLHMSALNANEANGPSIYLKTKGEAENRAHTLGQPQIKITSFRPSVIFGEDDSFINRFASLLQMAPGPFPLACPNARFAPVYVGDVVQAMYNALDDPSTWGKHYDLCGPGTYTLKELVEYTAQTLGIHKWIVGLSPGLSALQARMLGLVPGKPFTYDNYLSMQVDSVCSEDGLGQLGIEATRLESVVPYFLGQRSERLRYYQLITRQR
ncbi:complex I NDUFA9 subunit family protein [Solemya velesiana gill symbiont]|uniref:Epimerase n=1 Tax=Solemya velesiana gill symbiont TaxID=1918948 RepID=A0A1T2KWM5_9GAMM|nr:complex I NDUFA9 subunit family protein [Solemya velesiana gill symbiont]OOZ37201.1 epimerase [Solemya velesiana gill symbiont]